MIIKCGNDHFANQIKTLLPKCATRCWDIISLQINESKSQSVARLLRMFTSALKLRSEKEFLKIVRRGF